MEQLIIDIQTYCRAKGIKESTFGTRVGHNAKLVPRIARGGVLPRTEKKIRAYMRANPPTPEKVAAQ